LTSVTDLAEPGNRGIEPEVCNCGALRQAARHVTKLYDEALAPSGLGLNQYSILARLGRIGPSTIQDLARQLVMDRSTLGHLLRPLAARGLVTLAVGAVDRRSRTVALTPEGAALVARTRPLWDAAQRRFERAFGPDQAGALRVVLKTVATMDFTRPDAKGPESGLEETARV
jgi:DNA-binding MarR family transcriptional regulator